MTDLIPVCAPSGLTGLFDFEVRPSSAGPESTGRGTAAKTS